MGYKRKPKNYRMKFEGEFEGLEVVAKGMSVGKLLEMGKLIDVDTTVPTSEDIEKIDVLFDSFAQVLISWNLEDENDEPIAPTKEALYDQDLPFALMLITMYLQAVSGVPVPLELPSTSGDRSQEASLPMEVL